MRFSFARLFFISLIASSPLLGQGPVLVPVESREPPLASDLPDRLGGGFDPDESSEVRPAQYVVPGRPLTSPGLLPGELSSGTVVVPAGYTEAAGGLPTPQVTLDVEGSDVAATNQTVVYKLTVRNVSRAKAHNVVVKVIPPKKVTKVKADPPPTKDEDADTMWEYKILEPGQTKTIELAYKPDATADEVKIQARVQFDFGRGLITKIAAPTLSVKKDGPEQIVVGDTATYSITVTNTGKVTIRDIEVRDLLSKGLEYDDREIERGTLTGRLASNIDRKNGERTWTGLNLAPGESKVLDFRVKAKLPGRITSTSQVKAADIFKETGLDVEVLTAHLELKAEGPPNGMGKVGQPTVYRMTVTNRGNSDLRNVTVRCLIPPDMQVRKATHDGQPVRDSVQWTFPRLKVGLSEELSVSLQTKSPGMRSIQFVTKAQKGEEQKAQVKTEFLGMPSLDWDVEAPGVGAVGKQLTLRVTVSNRGTAPGKARVHVDLPSTTPTPLQVSSTTPKAGKGEGLNSNEVLFDEIDVPAGKKTTYTIRVDARSPGEAKVVFWLDEGTGEKKRDDKVINITAPDNRSPSGPPPARGVDKTNVGYSQRD
ncbi:MAG TPA: DUF11 domain-containing protein [Gemmataceae bacterium]|jgi:uncharacterized repeat protein (TIGR01451 family)|nr:DUF11 domain-containing protein [Gemmataceae bacterium]